MYPLVGSLTLMATDIVPSGYLVADGSAVSRQTYAGLFAVFGTTFGIGDGSTTFNLPDVRGLFVRFADDGSLRDPDRLTRTPAPGSTPIAPGSKQGDQIQSHSHTFAQWTLNIFSGVNDGATGLNALTVAGPTSASPGELENRPKNINVLGLVKY
jgi:microcystin-dependent protein